MTSKQNIREKGDGAVVRNGRAWLRVYLLQIAAPAAVFIFCLTTQSRARMRTVTAADRSVT